MKSSTKYRAAFYNAGARMVAEGYGSSRSIAAQRAAANLVENEANSVRVVDRTDDYGHLRLLVGPSGA